jgi:hypothetical protein
MAARNALALTSGEFQNFMLPPKLRNFRFVELQSCSCWNWPSKGASTAHFVACAMMRLREALTLLFWQHAFCHLTALKQY